MYFICLRLLGADRDPEVHQAHREEVGHQHEPVHAQLPALQPICEGSVEGGGGVLGVAAVIAVIAVITFIVVIIVVVYHCNPCFVIIVFDAIYLQPSL